jgi:hypothetical protein
MPGYSISQALAAIREILYHPVKTDKELLEEIMMVITETEETE